MAAHQTGPHGTRPLALGLTYVSSEDESYPASELNRPTVTMSTAPPKRGWQSAKLCDFPQEIGFRFDGDVELWQLQILAHQSKTPTKVEVFVSSFDGSELPPYHQAQFRKLGFLTFHNNEHNKYRNRERKTVQLKERACYVRLVLHKCHMNGLNLYNQVSIVQVLAFGEVVTPFQTRSGLYQQSGRPDGHVGGNLPPLRQQRGDPRASGAEDDDEDVYSLVPPAQRAGGAPYDPSPRQEPGVGGVGGKHVVLPPLSETPSKRHGGGGRVAASAAPAPMQPQAMQQPQQQAAYYDAYEQQQYSPVQAAPSPMSQAPPQQAPAQQQPGAMNGLVHYRSAIIVDFEDFYITTSQELTARKAQAVEVEDFDLAKSCKDQLSFLQTNAEKIYDLEGQKVRCIFEEDFDGAKRVKTQMDRLVHATRSGIEQAQKGRTAALHNAAAAEPYEPNGARDKHHRRRSAGPRRDDAAGDAYDDDEPPYDPRPAPADVPSFDEQPVQSKYAQKMAQQARKQRGPDDEDDEDGANDDADDGDSKRRKRATKDDDDDEEGSEAEADDDEEDDEADEEEEEEEEDEDAADDSDDDDDGKPRRQRKPHQQHRAKPNNTPSPPTESKGGAKGRPKRRQADADHAAADERPPPAAAPPAGDIDALPVGPKADDDTGFDVESFDPWERDVYFAIMDEAARDGTTEGAADPLDATEGMTDFHANFGKYTTACLFSRRWRLRDAAVRVITQFFDSMFKHAIPINAANAMLKYLDTKGHGLLDPIQTAFVSSCTFLTRLVDGRLPDVELSGAVASHVQALLTRLFLRSMDTTAKTRDEAITVIFVIANSSIGPERVAAACLAEPLDQDKRRMSTQNHRTYLSRLLVMQQLLTNHGLGRTISVDAIMPKLLLLCLNHQNSEVRDLAVVVTGCIDGSKGQEVMRYLQQVRNPATRAVIEEKLAYPEDADADSDGETRSPKDDAKVARSRSATKKRPAN